MTLILGAITSDCVVMVSDRRLTDGRTRRVINDSQNKCVCLYGVFILGYTGLAKLDGESTDRWVAKKLAGKNPIDSASILAAETARAVRAFDRGVRRHAYMLLGWAEDKGRIIPLCICPD
jgi:hypothetical protein